MPATITLTIRDGKLAGKRYTLTGRRKVMIGRGYDCDLQLADDPQLLCVSRHHCLITVGPAGVRVRDLGSRNGTSINGMQIGRPATWHLPPSLQSLPCREYDLHNGDQLGLGEAGFQVSVSLTAEGAPPRYPGSDSRHEIAACL
jgi:pSer/pThr/pTyr-binding forkhead associated (FHA) protein